MFGSVAATDAFPITAGGLIFQLWLYSILICILWIILDVLPVLRGMMAIADVFVAALWCKI